MAIKLPHRRWDWLRRVMMACSGGPMDAESTNKFEAIVPEIILNEEMAVMLGQFKTKCRLQGMGSNSTLSYASAMRIFVFFLMSKNKPPIEVDKNILKLYIDYLLNQRRIANSNSQRDPITRSVYATIHSSLSERTYDNSLQLLPIN
jgi:hypothetical protein